MIKNTIIIIGLYAWELNLPNIPYLIKKKITVTKRAYHE